MTGHEYIREAIRTYLEADVPARLATNLAADGLLTPNPSDMAFMLADGLQDVTVFPVVVVRSTDSKHEADTGDGVHLFRYDIEVIVACDHRVHGDAEGGSKDRDRVLRAVREAIYAVGGLGDDIEFVPGDRPEKTGAAMETRAGVPLAAGTLQFTARTLEVTHMDAATESIDAIDLTVNGVDALG